MICYYCESIEATTTRYGQPSCKECNETEIRAIQKPKEMSDQDKAFRLKLMMSAFKLAFEEDEEEANEQRD
ncbi:hypothetical protein [Brevibacillus daliensis]|uniref:hypothetical protein n=1 Tax=Brevibacillus daliensis TaxID=2892995 RepID=UPI001E3F405A|nr:hypothetical protein [Brevibacillus daliensis]